VGISVFVGWLNAVDTGVEVCLGSQDKSENTSGTHNRTLLAWVLLFLIRLLLA
jgi:hypothetical protein